MKLPRPHVPIMVRIEVAQRQLRGFGMTVDRNKDEESVAYLDRLLLTLSLCFESCFQPMVLDHDPALCNRQFSKRSGKYKPDANDPKFLIYRTKLDHDLKTRVRGDGAQLADLAMLRKNKRIAKRISTGKRPKYGVEK